VSAPARATTQVVRARRDRLRTSLLTSTAGLGLAALALASAQLALPAPMPPLVANLLAWAITAAVVAGVVMGWSWSRSLTALAASPEAARELAGRLPATLRRLVVAVGGIISAIALGEAARRGAPLAALYAGGAAATAALASLSVTAALAARLALRRARVPVGRATSVASDGVLLIVGALAPAMAMALGAGGPPAVVLSVFAWLLVLAASALRTLDIAAHTSLRRSGHILLALEAPPPPPGSTPPLGTALHDAAHAPALVREARALAQATAQLADRVTQLRLTQKLAVERALESERLRTQFLANTSHELRTPLHAVLGFTDLLLRGVDGPLEPEQRTSLERIRDSGTQLLRIVQEVLDLARMDAGKLELVRMPGIVTELIEQAVEEVRARFPDLTLDVSTRIERGLPTLQLDPYRVVQALTYLLAYAVEAVTVGSQRRKVRLLLAARRVDSAGGRTSVVELSLQAPDATLAADEPARVFDGFRLLTGRSGLGLGPHLGRRFVELHGGEVTLVAGQGVRFDVTLPVLPDTRPTGQVQVVTQPVPARGVLPSER